MPQLQKMLADGRSPCIPRGRVAEELERADRLYGEGKNEEAAERTGRSRRGSDGLDEYPRDRIAPFRARAPGRLRPGLARTGR